MKKFLACYLVYFLTITFGYANTDLYYEGAVYPHPNVFPIKTPYYVHWYPGANKRTPNDGLFHQAIVNGSSFGDTLNKNIDGWIAHETLPLVSLNIKRVAEWPAHVSAGDRLHYGVSLDEFVVDDKKNREYLEAITKIKKDHPQLFVLAFSVYKGPFTKLIAEQHSIIDFYVSESYRIGYRPKSTEDVNSKGYAPSTPDLITSLRNFGLIKKSALLLYVGGWNNYVMSPDILEREVAKIRELAPEMPGVGLAKVDDISAEFGTQKEIQSHWKEYERIIRKYYHDQSPSVTMNTSILGNGISITATATPHPVTQKPIKQYRYFLDNRCVRISNDPKVLIENIPAGKHFVTVHAVDESYLAGVAQTTVEIGK